MRSSALRSVLSTLQLSDSFFPSGMFAHSLGLEPMVRRGHIQTISDLESLIRGTLHHTVIPADGVALLNAHGAARTDDLDQIAAIDRRLFLMKAAPELRQASQQHGRRLIAETEHYTNNATLAAYRASVNARIVAGMGPVALGVISAALDLDETTVLAGYLHGYCVGLSSAAIRLLPISNTDCQRMLHRTHALLVAEIETIRGRPWTAMSSFTPALDVASMHHVHDDLRMFAS